MNSDVAVVVMVVIAGLMLAGLGAGIAFLLALQRTIERCAPQNRLLTPGQVWLNMIPLFGMVWQFIMVGRIADTLQCEFAARGTPRAPVPDDYGRRVGIAMCTLGVVSIIPYVGILTGLAGMVCGIIYWVKMVGYSNMLAQGQPAGQIASWPVPATAPAREAVSAGEQWWVAAVLTLGYGASYLQRVGLSVAVIAVRDELHIGTAQLGIVFSMFLYGLIAGYILMTVLTVLCGARWGLAAALLGASLASCASGLLPGFAGLLGARFVLGVFTGGLLPAAVQAARDWFPSAIRPLVIGAVLAVGPVVSMLTTATLGPLQMDWRTTMFATAFPTLIAAVMCLAWWPRPPAREPFIGISRPTFASSGMVVLGLLFAGPVSYLVMSWLAAYLRTLGGSVATISIAGTAVPIANALGALLAGLMAWALTSGRTNASRARATLLTVFGCLLPLVALGAIGNQGVVFAASALAMVGYGGWSVLLYSAVADAFPARGAAVGAAIGALAASISGIIGPLGIGTIVETFGYPTVFVAAGSTAVIAVAAVLLLAWLVGEQPARSSTAVAAF